jgi:Transcription elongation factor, GreA/GreB, C-term
MAQPNKSKLLEKIMEALRDSLAVIEKAARASHAEATHESSKAENKYDTRGLEAAYLAGGQARQAAEIVKSIKLYAALSVKDFGVSDPIDLSALIELETAGELGTYFIGPSSGGLEVRYKGAEITIITPHSPLGQQLMGKKTGQSWTTNFNGSRTHYRIISVT